MLKIKTEYQLKSITINSLRRNNKRTSGKMVRLKRDSSEKQSFWCNIMQSGAILLLLANFVQTSADISDFNDVILIKNDRHYYGTNKRLGNVDNWLCKDLLQRRANLNHVCQQRANLSARLEPICASDGQFYASTCDLELQSCLRNSTLTALSNTDQCISNHNHPPRQSDGRRGHLIKLKSQCDLSEFEQFKQLLVGANLRNVAQLFDNLDANKNNLIEAHELWPRIEMKSDKSGLLSSDNENLASSFDKQEEDLIIMQTMNNIFPANQFNSAKSSDNRAGNSIKARFSYAQVWPGVCPRNWPHCWRLLDFAFEPFFGTTTNPCSLSHLLIYAKEFALIQAENYTLNLEHFQQLFANSPFKTRELKGDLEERKDVILNENGNLYELVAIPLGGSLQLDCNLMEPAASECWWSRHGANPLPLYLRGDFHVSVNSTSGKLLIRDAQLYLSGPYKCHCKSSAQLLNREKLYMLQVIAEPHVELEPRSQFSMEKSRANFECVYNFIDTRAEVAPASLTNDPAHDSSQSDSKLEQVGQFGAKLLWKGKRSDKRYRVSMQASKLSIEPVNRNDSGKHTCKVKVPIRTTTTSQLEGDKFTSSEGSGTLSVVVDDKDNLELQNVSSLGRQNEKLDCDFEAGDRRVPLKLWIFQDSGIKVYRLRQDDGSDGEMELVRQLDGHSMISGQVDGNWNQLTLCGGLTPEQAVICEWSDNAIAINVPEKRQEDTIGTSGPSDFQTSTQKDLQDLQSGRKECKKGANYENTKGERQFIYVGQPNLNRIIVMDARAFEIVSIIQTEPQPRRLHLVKPNSVHLSKWIKRRLSPANILKLQQQAVSLQENYESATLASSKDETHQRPMLHNDKFASGANLLNAGQTSDTTKMPDANDAIAAQFDIWLLCYGQPLIVDPSMGSLVAGEALLGPPTFAQLSSARFNFTSRARNFRRQATLNRPINRRASARFNQADLNTWPFAWPAFLRAARPSGLESPVSSSVSGVVNDKESRLRNRKSVHIVQSTFFNLQAAQSEPSSSQEQPNWASNQLDSESPNFSSDHPKDESQSPIKQFGKSTLIGTHRLSIGRDFLSRQKDGFLAENGQEVAQVQDLIQDLALPDQVRALEGNRKQKVHFGYISHYNERRLFRVSLDNYRYEREIDLASANQCDPIELRPTALGLLVIQCRAAISHKLTGQLILDELTSKPMQFNEQIKAQDSYLSPDHKYLISVYTDQQQQIFNANGKRKRTATNENNGSNATNSIIYVQTLTTLGAQFQYQIKTSTLEISECSFVWRDGYFVAIFVSTNKLEQESEILSLRLADGRLELMARVPGLLDLHHRSRHRSQLSIAAQVHLAALSTNQGIFIVDLQENRISQSIQQHQSPPTLLWVGQ